MKAIRFTFLMLLVITGMTIIACNDDFLKTEDKKSYIMTDTLELSGYMADASFSLNIPEAKNSAYQIMIYPKWFSPQSFRGNFENGMLYVTFSTAHESDYASQVYIGSLVLDIDGFGYLEFVTRYWGANVAGVPSPVSNDHHAVLYKTR
jgi:hypothetical protein